MTGRRRSHPRLTRKLKITVALVIRDSMLEVRFPGMSRTGRERAVSVADLDEVPKGVVWLVGVRLIAMVAFKGRHWQQVYGEVPAVGQGKGPGAVPAWRPGIGVRGEGPGCPSRRAGPCGQFGQAGDRDRKVHPSGQRPGIVPRTGVEVLSGADVVGAGRTLASPRCARAAVTDRDAVRIGNGHAQSAVGAPCGCDREFAAQDRVERAEAVTLAGTLSPTEERRQGEHQVCQPWRSRRCRSRE